MHRWGAHRAPPSGAGQGLTRTPSLLAEEGHGEASPDVVVVAGDETTLLPVRLQPDRCVFASRGTRSERGRVKVAFLDDGGRTRRLPTGDTRGDEHDDPAFILERRRQDMARQRAQLQGFHRQHRLCLLRHDATPFSGKQVTGLLLNPHDRLALACPRVHAASSASIRSHARDNPSSARICDPSCSARRRVSSVRTISSRTRRRCSTVSPCGSTTPPTPSVWARPALKNWSLTYGSTSMGRPHCIARAVVPTPPWWITAATRGNSASCRTCPAM